MSTGEGNSQTHQAQDEVELRVKRLEAQFEVEKQRIATRGHIVGAAIGAVSAVAVALIGYAVSSRDVSPTPISKPSETIVESTSLGDQRALTFYIQHVYSAKLWERGKKLYDPAWEDRCKSLGTSILISMGFRMQSVPSDNATRGVADGMELGIQCFSELDHALIYGVAPTPKFEKLKAYGLALMANMGQQSKEFQ